MIDRTPSSNDTSISTLDIQLDEVRKELKKMSDEWEGDSLPDSLAALLNFESELCEAIKNIEDSEKLPTTTSEENSNDRYCTDSTREASQIQSDYEMAVNLSEEMQLEDASLQSSELSLDNISLFTPGYKTEIEHTDESIESPRSPSPFIPEVNLNDHISRDSSEEDPQIQRDYWMAVLLSEEMQLEDAGLKSSGKPVESCDDVSSSIYKFRTQIGTLDQGFEGSRNSNSTTPVIDSNDHDSVVSSTDYFQIQHDYEIAAQLSEEMQLENVSLRSSELSLDNISLLTPGYKTGIEHTDESIESPRSPSPFIPEVNLNDHISKESSEEDLQIQRDYWMAVLLSEEMQLEDARLRSSEKN